MATVIPIFKKYAADNIANYRSILILSIFSKHVKKLIHYRITNFILLQRGNLDLERADRPKQLPIDENTVILFSNDTSLAVSARTSEQLVILLLKLLSICITTITIKLNYLSTK